MSYKENLAFGVGTSMSVKPEPVDTFIPRPFATSLNNAQRLPKAPVKAEYSDHTIDALTSRGINLPQTTTHSGHLAPIPAPKPVGPHYKLYASAQEIVYSPEDALSNGLGMVKTLDSLIKRLSLGSKLRQDVWNGELAALRSQTAPTTLIAVCGATGAGKSSILNAVLDDNIVPTSGMRACTATVTEIAYHNKPTIDADVSFLSESEWKEELAVLLEDLVDEDGTIKRSADLRSEAGVAWQKVHAVYPTISVEALVQMTPDEIVAKDTEIAAILGVTKSIFARDSKAFATEIGKYIDSKDQSRGKKDKKKKGEDEEANDDEPKATMYEKVLAAAGKEKSKDKKKEKRESDVNAPALWPLIRQVNVRCNSKALSTGSILVDLPGVADANAARSNIAKDYMKKCQCIWILAPITRAVDDKTARDLLGDAFKMQLMNGNYDDHSITFIASKCDDIACSEVIRALKLDDDEELEAIEEQIKENTDKTKETKMRKSATERKLKAVDKELKEMRAIQREYKAYSKALKKGELFTLKLTAKNKKVAGMKRKNIRGGKKGKSKRQKSVESNGDDEDNDEEDDSDVESDEDSDASDSDEDSDSDDDGSDSDATDREDNDNDSTSVDDDEDEVEETPETLKLKITKCKDKIKALRARQAESRKLKKNLADDIATLKKQMTSLQKLKNGFCALKRSEFSRDVLKEDFRSGLKDLDDSAAEEKDPDNFDPTVTIRDYEKIDLPVFTCSSRDYVRLTGQVKGDGDASCFSNIKDTGIPSLQQWCHTLTLSSRERSAKIFIKHLLAFIDSVSSYIDGIRGVTSADRESLREKWETGDVACYDSNDEGDGMSVDEDPFSAILGGGGQLYTMKEDEKYPKVGAHGQPVGITLRLTKDFASVIEENVENLKNSFHDGLEDKCKIGASNAAASAVATSDDFTTSMHWQTYRATLRRHGSWRRDLNVELLGPFTKNIAASWGKLFETNLLAKFQEATMRAVTILLKEFEESAAPGLRDRTKTQAIVCLEEVRVTLQKTIEVVSESLSNEQKEISRCLAPHVQAELVDGYERALEERGLGSVKRQKVIFRQYVQDHKDNIFDDGANVIMERLGMAAMSVGSGLAEAMGQLAQKIEVNLAVLWEGGNDNPNQIKARDDILKEVEILKGQIKLWQTAGEEKKELEAQKRENEQEERYEQIVKDCLVDDDVEMN